MNIQGLQKTTLLDFPGHVAATIFVSGCNFRCPFCHNMNLVLSKDMPVYSSEEIFTFLKKRQGILDGICITGGEPTLYKDLPDFIRSVRSLDYKIKLDTNGSDPDMLNFLLSSHLVDYVAMDVKSSISEYNRITDTPNLNTGNILRSINILNSSDMDHEFRTTFIKDFHTPEVISSIGLMLKGSPKYFIQSFKDSDFVPDHNLTAFTKEELQSIRSQLLEYISSVEIRGVD